jgi:hypothetical protein
MAGDQMKNEQSRVAPNLDTKQLWREPLMDWLKINFDGAFCPKTKVDAWEFIIHDYTGECVLAGASGGYCQLGIGIRDNCMSRRTPFQTL